MKLDPATPLRAFAELFLRGLVPGNPIETWDYGKIVSLVLVRQGPFQVELFLLRNEAAFPAEHRHPHVDTFEIPLCGMVEIYRNGVLTAPDDRIAGMPALRLGPGDWHGMTLNPVGGAFFSVQKWDGMEPSSVGMDWEGPVPSPEHEQRLREHGGHDSP